MRIEIKESLARKVRLPGHRILIATAIAIGITVILLSRSAEGSLTTGLDNKADSSAFIHDSASLWVQNRSLGNSFYTQEPFVDEQSRLPPRDDPAYLRSRASGLQNDISDPLYVDPYNPLPAQQPPAVFPHDHGVDRPAALQTPDTQGPSASETQPASIFSNDNFLQPRERVAPSSQNVEALQPPVFRETQVLPQPQSDVQLTQKRDENSLRGLAEFPVQFPLIQDQIPVPPLPTVSAPVRNTQNEGLDFSNSYFLPMADKVRINEEIDIEIESFSTRQLNPAAPYPDRIETQPLTVGQLPTAVITAPDQSRVPAVISALPADNDAIEIKDQGRFGAHLASYFNESDAQRGWDILQKKTNNLLVGLTKVIVPVTINGRQYYRLLAGQFRSVRHAQRICQRFSDSGLFCNTMPFY